MQVVKMPRLLIVAVGMSLFLAALYGVRQFGALGSAEHALLALGAGAVCLAIVAGLIYANKTGTPG